MREWKSEPERLAGWVEAICRDQARGVEKERERRRLFFLEGWPLFPFDPAAKKERYDPRPEELAALVRHFPDADPALPPWGDVQTALTARGFSEDGFHSLTAPTAIVLLDRLVADGPPAGKGMSRDEANSKAADLLTKDPDFASESQREWSRRIGCSHGLVPKLPLWQAIHRETDRPAKSGKVVALTPRTLATIPARGDESEEELQRLVKEQDQDAKTDCPTGRQVRVHRRL